MLVHEPAKMPLNENEPEAINVFRKMLMDELEAIKIFRRCS